MKIDRLHIDSFGHFEDFDLELSPGLNLVHGQNEAGKSTLLGFVRSVLFGFERRNAPTRYELGNGTFGGELWLSTPRGPLCVRRTGGRKVEGEVTLKGPHGAPENPSRLLEALHGVSRELFCQVFAFGLYELSTFEDLAHQSSVTEALFAAGMQGARRLPEVTAELRGRSEELYRPSGRKQELNALFARLEEVRSALDALGDRPARYFDLLERRADLEQRAQAMLLSLQRARSERERLSALEKVAPALLTLGRIERELAELPSALDDFPADGVARLEASLAQSRRASQQVQQARAEWQDLEAKREEAERALLPKDAVQDLRAAKDAFASRLAVYRALPSRTAELAARAAQAQQSATQLGLKVAAEDLLALDTGAAAKTKLVSIKAAIDQTARAHSDRKAEERDAHKRLSDVQAQTERKRAEHDALTALPAAGLRRMQSALTRLPTLELEERRLLEQTQDLQRDLQELTGTKEPAPQAPVPAALIAVAAVFGLGIAFAAWRYNGLPTALVALGVASLLVGAIAFLQRRGAQAYQAALAAQKERAHRREAQARDKREALGRAQERLTAVEQERQAACRDAELDGPRHAHDQELKARQQEVAELLRQAEERLHLAKELAALEEKGAELQRETDGARSRTREAETELALANRALAEFLAARALPSDLDGDAALSLFGSVVEVQRTLRDVAALEQALSSDEADAQACAQRLFEAARACGLEVDGQGVQAAEAVGSRAAEVIERRAATAQALEQLSVRLSEVRQRLGRAEAEQRDADEKTAALLSRAGAQDEETFRKQAERALLRAEALRAVQKERAAVEAGARCAPEEAARQIAEAGGADASRARAQELASQVEAQEAEYAALEQERGSVRTELQGLETDGQVAELRAEEERLVERARVLARRYAKDRLGLSLLARARRQYEEEQQPKVVQLASAHFTHLTGHRYTRVFVPAGEETELRVVDAQAQEKSAEQLSRGTREQLYLAFRLAVVEDFGETRGPLPVVLDDILVNFDPHRANSAVKALSRLSQKHQVIAFTCHPWLRDLFAAEGAKVEELNGAEERKLAAL